MGHLMTVAELIEALREFDQSLEVWTHDPVEVDAARYTVDDVPLTPDMIFVDKRKLWIWVGGQ